MAITAGSDMNAGNIPPELSKLSKLQYLALGENCLSGKINETISFVFDFLNVGNIPTELSQLSNLKALTLCKNRLSGELFKVTLRQL